MFVAPRQYLLTPRAEWTSPEGRERCSRQLRQPVVSAADGPQWKAAGRYIKYRHVPQLRHGARRYRVAARWIRAAVRARHNTLDLDEHPVLRPADQSDHQSGWTHSPVHAHLQRQSGPGLESRRRRRLPCRWTGGGDIRRPILLGPAGFRLPERLSAVEPGRLDPKRPLERGS